MAADNEVLGISGQMDITDIQSSIDRLCDSLNKVGVDTDAMSQKMTKALNDIAQSDGDLASKTQAAMAVLKQAMDEAQKSASDVPSMIETAQGNVDRCAQSIQTLNDKLAQTPKGSEAYGEISKQIESQSSAMKMAKDDVNDLVSSYAGVKEEISHVQGAYEALGAIAAGSATANTAQSASNVAVGATATAAATATGVEAAAHMANSAAATQNAEAENANAQATSNLTESLKEYISTAAGRADVERMQTENSRDLRAEIKQYEDAIKDIQNQLATTDYTGEIERATAKIEYYKNKIEEYKQSLTNLSPEDNAGGGGAIYYESLIRNAQENLDKQQEKVVSLQHEQERLNKDLQEQTILLQAARDIQDGQTIVQPEAQTMQIDVQSTSLTDLQSQLDDSKQKLQELQSEADRFNGKSLGDKQQADLNRLNGDIDATKAKIQALQEAIREKNDETFVGKLRNGISDLGDKCSEIATKIKESIGGAIDNVKQKIAGTSFGRRFGAEFEQIKLGAEDVTHSLGNFLSGGGRANALISQLSTTLTQFGLPIGAATKAITGLTAATLRFCFTPIGAILTVIVLGLKAVHTWLTKSSEGQKVYTRLTAYFGSIAKSVTDIVIALGSWLYRCFTQPNGALRAFGNNFIHTFKTAVGAAINLVGGLGTTLKGIFTLNWDTFTSGIRQTWNGLKGVGNTVISGFKTALTGAVGAVKLAYSAMTDKQLSSGLKNVLGGNGMKMFTTAAQDASLAGKIQNTQLAITQNSEKQLMLDRQIAEQRNKIYTLTGRAKIEAIEATKALIRQKYDTQIKQQQQLVELSARQANLHNKSLETIAAERQLRMDVIRTQTQQISEQRMLTRQEEAAKRSLASQVKSAASKAASAAKTAARQSAQVSAAEGKLNETSYKNDQEREKVLTDLDSKLADARIAAMQEGFGKTMAERERENQKELEQIESQRETALLAERSRQKAEFDARQAIVKARGGKAATWDDKTDFEQTQDVEDINKKYDKLVNLTVQQQIEKERNDEDKLVQSHQSYTDRKLGIDQKYQLALAEIDKAITEAESRGDTERVDALQRSRNQALADEAKEKMKLAFDELKNSPDYVAAFTDIDKASTSTLNKLVARFEAVKSAAAASLNPEDAKTYFDTVNGLIDELIKRDPVGVAKKLTKELVEQKKEYTEAQQLLKDVQNGTGTSNTIKEWKLEGDYSKGTAKMVPVYYTLAEAEAKVATAGQAVAHSQSKIQAANKQTLTEISNLNSAFSSLGNVIGGEAGQIIGLTAGIGNFVTTAANAMMSVSATASKAIRAMETASAILTIMSATVSIVSKINSVFKTSDDYYEKTAKKQQKINGLRQAVDDYRLSVIKARQEENDWFGATGLDNLKSSWEQHAQSGRNYYNEFYEAQEVYKNKKSGIAKYGVPIATAAAAIVAGALTYGAGAAGVLAASAGIGAVAASTAIAAGTAVAGYALGAAAQSALNGITYKNGQTAAYNNLRIQTRHKSFWRGQKTADLRQWVSENLTDNQGNPAQLFDEQGLLNLEVAQTVLDKYSDKLQGQTKETLERLKKLREEYDEYQKELKEYVSQTYEPLVDDMSSAVWTWLTEGKDALQQFKESASKTFSDIGKEMLKQIMLKTVFNGFEDKLKDLYDRYAQGGLTDTQLAEQIGGVMSGVMSAANIQIPMLEQFATQYRDILAKLGIDVSGNTEQSASAKGVTSITYDQANFLTNLATARNIALEKGNEVRKQILDALISKGYVDKTTLPASYTSDNVTSVSTVSEVDNKIQQALANSNIDTGALLSVIAANSSNLSPSQMMSMLQEKYGVSNDTQSYAILTAVQNLGIDSTTIKAATLQIQDDISVMRDIQEQGLTQLNRIETNTRPINDILSVVNNIYKWQRDNA